MFSHGLAGVRPDGPQVKRSFCILGLSTGDGFGYSPRLAFRRRSSVVERILGKAEVGSSILPGGTMVL